MQCVECTGEVFAFHQNIICVERGHGENADTVICKDAGNRRENTDKRKIKRALNPKCLPAVVRSVVRSGVLLVSHTKEISSSVRAAK